MTTYLWKLELSDSQVVALKSAIHYYMKHCEDQLRDGPKAPYWAHHKALDGMSQSFLITGQMSGNGFGDSVDEVR